MEHTAEDYYDMPVEMLPSANFAGRPTSEISTSMLDGLWTMMFSSSSNLEDEADDDDDTALRIRTPSRSAPSQTQPESPEPPTIRIRSPSLNNNPKLQRRNLSNDGNIMDQPRLRKKSQTAPPGAFEAFIAPPLEPRRAISARLTYTNTIRRGQSKACDSLANCLDIEKASSNERLGPRKALPKPPCQNNEAISSGMKHHPGSFSDRARVQEALKQKQLRTLNTALADFESKKLPTSPSSMLSTPRECYAIPNELATSETLDSPHSPRSWGRKSVKSVETIIHHKTHSPFSARANVEGRRTLKRKHNNGDVDAAERRTVYLPGAIMLAEHPAKLRRDSVATLDPFTFDPRLDSPGRRISDIVGLDGIVMFFEEFGVVGQVTEVTFDQYWLRKSLIMSDDMDEEMEDMVARKRSVGSVKETGPLGSWVAQSPRREGLKSKFSSASSTVSMHAPEKRKRSRLRGLLSPGLPGAAFLKSPASWGQHIESS
ncbi:uncharacterized protein ALTATR162_LOCUS7176 [Alternaria atra]|uniref:Uncharacterized protein n=1 Tax=Alternaria atra TaxID=119953 RepID=A0A8J2N7X0_9PLEO|nr:uncharacterized protein ALTATR162_LOCUS7176 [Alternaria atra]CAG5170381.1 unnamed protein product [Alternaria atra]